MSGSQRKEPEQCHHGEDPRALQGRGGDMSLRGGASIGNLRLPDRCELRLQTLVRRKDRREREVSLHIEEGCVALVTLPKRQTPRDIHLAETLELLFAVRRISGAAHSGSGWSAHDERRDNWLGGTFFFLFVCFGMFLGRTHGATRYKRVKIASGTGTLVEARGNPRDALSVRVSTEAWNSRLGSRVGQQSPDCSLPEQPPQPHFPREVGGFEPQQNPLPRPSEVARGYEWVGDPWRRLCRGLRAQRSM